MGNSDPGRNGLLSPWGKIKGLYFDDSMETGNFFWNLQHDLNEYYRDKGKIYIMMEFDKEEDYYSALYQLQQMKKITTSIFRLRRLTLAEARLLSIIPIRIINLLN